MKKLVLLISLTLLGSAGTVFAQTACPTDGSCPSDVGACLAESCPCAADHGGGAWKNHGQYVKCVVHLRNDLRKAGCLDAAAKRTIASCAARSTCGKEGAVLCCVYDTSGTCDLASSTCTNDATITCASDTDCITVVSGPKVKRHAETCTDHGGTDVGGGSVCGGCPLPPPAP